MTQQIDTIESLASSIVCDRGVGGESSEGGGAGGGGGRGGLHFQISPVFTFPFFGVSIGAKEWEERGRDRRGAAEF